MKFVKGFKLKEHSILPGFGLTLGFTVLYAGLLVLFPLATVFAKAAGAGWERIAQILTEPRLLAAYKLSFGTALAASLINAVFGLLVAWVLVRYHFPGRRIIDGLVDLPFALPTAVAGIVLTTLYAPNGWIGQFLQPLGLRVSFTPLGIITALVFIGMPFVVRMVQPVLETLDKEVEEAAASLGAGRLDTFLKIILPELLPALLTGFALSFARALGEYGSVVFISGNMPLKTEIVPLFIMTKLEQYDYAGASIVAASMLALSFVLLVLINGLQWWSTHRYERK